ncbi:hypothetical protein F441_08864 [Phytophthora nicotianae CJ01A1]|uniref:TFIIS N-terminal domain-containing protein n=4 Tax=Phytophthora nicotianae TaxID=4792 RepID=W2ZBE8_PHYNI|nr:hypothetical protein L915_08718 [Phytophthora nicotianae]ETO75443.1 hypothetical protein F444_08954 [Phytophthora nicotianae P1976]ETP16564.1 hypothetical protein F441_08864 [Phytophthora nicotianae CJ01A1]ETP44588.1 hypothetical protein F442_08827 [Phytophthora nicotianae P10297]KUF91010.1 hypothetical protein AM587_10008333 [Phytophthora nicotianae]
MAHIETKDPFGFVGSHVVRKQPRKGGEEHGWLTRYDEVLDCYTLFVPGGGEPRLLARGEVMKFLSAPNVELHDDDQDEFPPPVKDTSTSRYLGVKLRRPPQHSRDDENTMDEDIRGHVTCFLPFGDRYCVEYEDGSAEEMSESAVIDGMIALIKSPFFSSPSHKNTRNGSIRTRRSIEELDGEVTVPVRRKRQRVKTLSDEEVQEIPNGSVAVVENVADQQQDNDVVIVDQAEVEAETSTETEPAPNILEIMSSTLGTSTPRENSLEMASHPVEETIHIDEGEVAGQDDTAAEVFDTPEEPVSSGGLTDAAQTDAAPMEGQKDVPFYIIEKKPHAATEPLPRRAMAFELLRASLLNLLDRREASTVKIAMQYDLLRNPDVRDRDAVIRLMNADGLLVLNHLLNSYATEVLEDEEEETKDDSPEKIRERMERDDELLHVLKIVAMLPTPSRDQVIASNIGKTINYLTKKRGPPGRKSVLPKCITALAKWIKSSWIKNIPPAPKVSPKAAFKPRQPASRPQQQARRGGRGGSRGRPNLQLNRRQPPPSKRPQRQVSLVPRTPPEEQRIPVDNTPIPRLPRPSSQRAVATSAPAPPQPPAPRRVTGGLKPDWMRQKENLSRSRFCIDDYTNVDTRLYRDNRAHPITNVPVVGTPSQALTQQDQNPDQHEDAGGPDGVFGRSQRLRFGKRWSTQEFGMMDPPGTLRQPPRSYSMPSYSRSLYSDQYASVYVPPVPNSSRRPRSILRRVSRYNDEPAIDGPGS